MSEKGTIQETIKQLEKTIQSSRSLTTKKRNELNHLVEELRGELAELEINEKEQAQSIADFAHLTARESLRDQKDQELLNLSAQGLKTSIRKFEVTHPNLTRVIQSICMAFGI